MSWVAEEIGDIGRDQTLEGCKCHGYNKSSLNIHQLGELHQGLFLGPWSSSYVKLT